MLCNYSIHFFTESYYCTYFTAYPANVSKICTKKACFSCFAHRKKEAPGLLFFWCSVPLRLVAAAVAATVVAAVVAAIAAAVAVVAAAVVAAAATAAVVAAAAIKAVVAAAEEENDEDENYPDAAFVIVAEHIYCLSPRIKFRSTVRRGGLTTR